jgi:DNA polymerase-1
MADEPHLRETFESGRDPYATLVAPAFHMDYWDCMEHYQDGSPNPDGKKMRSKGKILMLGISYGMGAKLMAKSMGIPFEQCKQVLADFYATFPKIKEFSERNEKDAYEKGYVEDYLGRRRHLPDARLKEIEITQTKPVKTNADLIFGFPNSDSTINVPDKEAIKKWTDIWERYVATGKFNAKSQFRKFAQENGISFKDNGGYISKTKTQCTNARIQGSAASLTKKAMVAIFNDEEMRKLGFRLLIPVHDELLGECPVENAERVSQRLSELMIGATKPEVSIKFKCDPYIAKHWYADEVEHEISNEFKHMTNGNPSKGILPIDEKTALDNLKEKYPEISPQIVEEMCNGSYDIMGDAI